MYLISLILRHLEETKENIDGLLPDMFRKAGFEHVEETARFMTLFGTLSLYMAKNMNKRRYLFTFFLPVQPRIAPKIARSASNAGAFAVSAGV